MGQHKIFSAVTRYNAIKMVSFSGEIYRRKPYYQTQKAAFLFNATEISWRLITMQIPNAYAYA